jgi:hypothetical protein
MYDMYHLTLLVIPATFAYLTIRAIARNLSTRG